MDQFPDDIDRKNCIQNYNIKQLELLRETRKIFTEKIISSLKELNTEIILKFNEYMDRKYKKIIINELLERFLNLYLIKKGTTCIEVFINNKDQIINDSTHIKIIL
ncbi:hypothetical protein Hokovirus_3_47 [Hokovirus HKV1]|uniref:Uncharacterized protein n=1 Tax=Hokovirus HKV1 TaxID=1977638 RepID=A0A1V0SGK3_9VIRU|nr:hypothetical protein Hokovirus_3_47 [Hokovirus HKV1]